MHSCAASQAMSMYPLPAWSTSASEAVPDAFVRRCWAAATTVSRFARNQLMLYLTLREANTVMSGSAACAAILSSSD